VITEPFQGLVQAFAAQLGAPGYEAVLVPHPVASRQPAQLERLAPAAAAVVLRHLTAGRAARP
jgi:hypothetical protein